MMLQDVGGLACWVVAGRAVAASLAIVVASSPAGGAEPSGELPRLLVPQGKSSAEVETKRSSPRTPSWMVKAGLSKALSRQLFEAGDLAGAARARLDFVDALTHINGADDWLTRREAALAREWEAVSLLEPALQSRYMATFLTVHNPRPDPDARADELVEDADIHLLDLQSVLGDVSITLTVVLNQIGDSALRKKNYDEAIDCFYRSLSILESECGAGHPDAGPILSRIGDGHFGLEQYEEASRSYHEVLEIVYEHQGEESQNYVGVLLTMAGIHAAQSHLAEAEALLLKAYQLSSSASIDDDRLRGEVRYGLAEVLVRCGNFQEADEMLQFSRRHFERISVGAEQKLERSNKLQETIDKGMALGQNYSREYHDYTLEWLKEENDSPPEEDQESRDDARSRLAETAEQMSDYLQEGDLASLIELQRERIAITKRQTQPGHPGIVREEVMLAEWERVLELSNQEQCLYLEAAQTWRAVSEQKDDNQAPSNRLEPMLQQALALLEGLPIDSVFELGVRGHLASLAARRHDYDTAIGHTRELIASSERLFGPHHPHVYGALETLAYLHVEAGDLEEGDRLLREIQLPLRKLLRMNSPTYVGWLYNAAGINLKRGKLIEAETLCRQAIDLGARMYSPSASLKAACHCRLAEVYVAREMFEKADEMFEAALKICELEEVEQSTAMSRGLRTHAALLQRLGREAEANEKLAKAVAMTPR